MFAEKLTLTGRSKILNNFRTYGMRHVTRQKSWNKISSFYDPSAAEISVCDS